MDSECSQLQQELQDSKDQNELLEFRILELEVSHNELPSKIFFKKDISHFPLIKKKKIFLPALEI